MRSIREASAYFNIGAKKMREMAEDNERGLGLFMGSQYLICQPEFEEYLRDLLENPENLLKLRWHGGTNYGYNRLNKR